MKRLLYILSILLCLASCKEDEVIISQHGTTYDTVRVNVRQNLYDTVRKLIYDTTRTKVYDTVHATVNDTVWNHQTITSYDTIRTIISDTITIKNYDTVRIVKTITNYDTVKTVIKDTIITKINDTIWSHQTINDTVWSHQIVKDTVWDYQTVVKYDTVRTKVNDTVWSYETVVRYDTLKVQVYDTIYIEISPKNYSWIKYVINPNSGEQDSLLAENGKTITLKSDIRRDGYSFRYWNTQSDGGGHSYNAGSDYIVNGNVVMYGVWKNEKGISVSQVYDYLSSASCNDTVEIRITDLKPDLKILASYLNDNSCKKIILDLEDCTGLTEITESTFNDCCNLYKIQLPNSITKIGDNAFSCSYDKKSSLSEIKLPEQLVEIGEDSFYNCRDLKGINLPESVSLIGKNAFWLCNSIQEITLPKRITIIKEGVFVGCTSLKSITLPENLIRIEEEAFSGCGLTSITIPKSVMYIGCCVFEHCSNLNSIKFESEIPPVAKGDIGFYETKTSGIMNPTYYVEYEGPQIIYVPSSALVTYRKEDGCWNRYAEYYVGY